MIVKQLDFTTFEKVLGGACRAVDCEKVGSILLI